MVTSPGEVLIVGNYCHDLLIQDSAVKAESLGGAASFISNVFTEMSIPCMLISKVGDDFRYPVNHPPIISPGARTTAFHAYFNSATGQHPDDRVLKRVSSCDPILPSDLPDSKKFNFGMAVGVAGEVSPETLEKMIQICDLVFVDVQALIRDFDEGDGGTVKLMKLRETGFFPLLPRIGVLKASSEEAAFLDVEEVRKLCCVVVTNGKDGCTVYWKDGSTKISPFLASQKDPTGAGDSFLGGFVAGLVHGLAVPDAALLGNFFGALTVEQIGLPRFSARVMQRVKDEVQRRNHQEDGRANELNFFRPVGHEQFEAALCSSRTVLQCSVQECHWHPPGSYAAMEQDIQLLKCTTTTTGGQSKLVTETTYEQVSTTSDSTPNG